MLACISNWLRLDDVNIIYKLILFNSICDVMNENKKISWKRVFLKSGQLPLECYFLAMCIKTKHNRWTCFFYRRESKDKFYLVTAKHLFLDENWAFCKQEKITVYQKDLLKSSEVIPIEVSIEDYIFPDDENTDIVILWQSSVFLADSMKDKVFQCTTFEWNFNFWCDCITIWRPKVLENTDSNLEDAVANPFWTLRKWVVAWIRPYTRTWKPYLHYGYFFDWYIDWWYSWWPWIVYDLENKKYYVIWVMTESLFDKWEFDDWKPFLDVWLSFMDSISNVKDAVSNFESLK